LQEVDINFRPVQHHFADQPPGKEPTPVDAGLDNREIGDRNIRMGYGKHEKSGPPVGLMASNF
jgi:hypothetical protein